MPPTPGESSDSRPVGSFARWLDGIVPALYPTDAALARTIGVRQSTVMRWRRGSMPQVPALLKLAEVTGTSAGTLLRIAGYRPEGND